MRQRPLGDAIAVTIRQQQDHAQKQGLPRPDPEVIRARIGRALTVSDNKQSR